MNLYLPPYPVVATSLMIIIFVMFTSAAATWCVACSDASEQALKTALDYACGSGADCTPIQPGGLCFLPNTMQAHASYAYNSYYQQKCYMPGSCNFSSTATVAKTDPSYGSCVYPPSSSQAGDTGTSIGNGNGTGMGTSTGTGTTTPSLSIPPPPATTLLLYGNDSLSPGFTPGMGTMEPITANSVKTRGFSHRIMLVVYIFWSCFFSFLFYVPI